MTSKLRTYHRRSGVVADLRLAPPRNDAALRGSARSFRAALQACFARVAVLLQTPVGVLQVNRVKRDEGAALFFVTMNEDEALLFAEVTSSSSPPKPIFWVGRAGRPKPPSWKHNLMLFGVPGGAWSDSWVSRVLSGGGRPAVEQRRPDRIQT